MKRVIKESVMSSKNINLQSETDGEYKMKRYIKATTSEPFIYDGTTRPPKDVTEVVVANNVTSIGDFEFADRKELTSIAIPDSVKSIGKRAFINCRSLTSITIPKGVKIIGDGAFAECRSLTSITIPNGVTSIGDGTFTHCEKLTSITIPDSVMSIGNSAFHFCKSFTSITIPDSVKSIGDGAFSYCYSLTSITIPDSVTTLGDSAFEWCESLTSITIPDSVTHIGEDAFRDCNKLTSFKCSDKVKALIDGPKIKNHIDLNEDEDDYEDEWGTIESDDDFNEYMQGFGSDVMDKITEKYPDIEINYEQNGQGGYYTNDFFGTTPDGNSFSATISDSELLEYDNYNDIIEYAVNQVVSEIESAGDIVTI